MRMMMRIVDESETVADLRPRTQHNEDDEGIQLINKPMETPNREVEHSRPGPTNDDNKSAHPLQPVVGHTGSSDVLSPIAQRSDAEILLQTEEIRIPFHIELQIEQDPGGEQEAPSAGDEGGGGVFNQLPKIPSVSALQRMHLVTTESETDHQQYGGSSEWEEDTDSVNYMEFLPKSNHKPRKPKIKKLSAPTSSRKLRSNKSVNAFGYESR